MLRPCGLHQMRNLMIERIRFRRDTRFDSAFILNRLRESRFPLIAHPTRFLRIRASEVCDFVEERDLLLREGGAVDVAHAGADGDEGGGESE